MLVASIFSFSHNTFYPIREKNHHFINIFCVVYKCFQFRPAKNFANFCFSLSYTYILLLAFAFIMDQAKIFVFDKESVCLYITEIYLYVCYTFFYSWMKFKNFSCRPVYLAHVFCYVFTKQPKF